jgi:oligosaccharide repeat unit polymerase
LNVNTVIEESIGRRSNNVTTVAHIIRYVDRDFELLNGEMFSAFFTRFVPRALWPDKPIGMGRQVADVLYGDFQNRAGSSGVNVTFLGELYWNFYIPGVAIGMLIFGIYIRTIYEYLRRSPINPWSVVIFGVSLNYIIYLLRVDFASAALDYVLVIIPIVVATMFVSQSNRTKKYFHVKHA